MPRDTKRVGKKSKKSFTGSDYDFVDVRIAQKDKETFRKWAQETADDSVTLLSSLVNSGYKVSISWSDYNDCYTVSFTGTEETSPNYHLVMTSRSDDVWEAMMIALYKHFVQCGGADWPTDKQSNDWG